jgi:hypothetical protein
MPKILSEPGLRALVELSMSTIEAAHPLLPSSSSQFLEDSFTQYLRGALSYEKCLEHEIAVLHREVAVARLREILCVGDDPLPYLDGQSSAALSSRQKTRPWSAIEDQRLLAAILRIGFDNWRYVSLFVGNGRNRAQCSQRWFRGLNPKISKEPWTPEEEARLIQLVKQWGVKSWAKIATALGKRSDVQCRYHYKQIENRTGDSVLNNNERICSSYERLPQVRLTLEQSRRYLSSPALGPRTAVPKAEMPEGEAAEKKWGICGTDPKSLAMFLGHFT